MGPPCNVLKFCLISSLILSLSSGAPTEPGAAESNKKVTLVMEPTAGGLVNQNEAGQQSTGLKSQNPSGSPDGTAIEPELKPNATDPKVNPEVTGATGQGDDAPQLNNTGSAGDKSGVANEQGGTSGAHQTGGTEKAKDAGKDTEPPKIGGETEDKTNQDKTGKANEQGGTSGAHQTGGTEKAKDAVKDTEPPKIGGETEDKTNQGEGDKENGAGEKVGENNKQNNEPTKKTDDENKKNDDSAKKEDDKNQETKAKGEKEGDQEKEKQEKTGESEKQDNTENQDEKDEKSQVFTGGSSSTSSTTTTLSWSTTELDNIDIDSEQDKEGSVADGDKNKGKGEETQHKEEQSKGETVKTQKLSEDYDDFDEENSSGHFMAYFLTATVFCIAGYVIFHNKQKIMAFILEGRKGQSRRPSSKSYQKLKTKVDDVMPALEKSTTNSNYVY